MKHRTTPLILAASLLAMPFACTTPPTCAAPPAKEARATHTSDGLHALGYVPDKHFPKGVRTFENSTFKATPVLPSVDLSNLLTPDDDQGQVGRCTGFGLGGTLSGSLKKLYGGNFLIFSPDFIYFNERKRMGTINQDSGAMIGEDGVASLQAEGACFLTSWPLTSTLNTKKPCAACYSEGLKHVVIHAYKVDNRNGQDLERALSGGFLVVYGIILHQSFEALSPTNYVYKGTGPIIGGHCMRYYKYNLTAKAIDGLAPGQIRSRNQWGAKKWGRADDYDMPLSGPHGAHSSDVDDCYVFDAVKQ